MSDDLRRVRLEKLEKLKAEGVHPYPERFARTCSLAEAQKLEPAKPGETPETVRVAGRLVLIRDMGKRVFAHVQDLGGRLQLTFGATDLDADAERSKELYKRFVKLVDLGDFVGVEGRIDRTRTGELTLFARSWTFLGKALLPLPEKWHGLQDTEQAWRYRYLDLIANEDARRRFRLRTSVIKSIRRTLETAGFEEVETPVLCTHPSGALAKPFISHHNSLDMEVFLRIAPETYLKRCVVGGFERVYEFARCFRNEGMDPSHLQDFTMLEWYAAYWNYQDNMDFTEKMVKATIQEVTGGLSIKRGDRMIDFAGTWPRWRLRDVLLERSGIDIDLHADAASLRRAIFEKKVDLENPGAGRGSLIDQLYKRTARPHLKDPVFIVRHPLDLSPLARRSDDDARTVDRFQLVVDTWEVVNAYSELVDPLDQRARLEDQARQHAQGDDEAMVEDEDYLLSMEHGMPPISGFGMGIDRFVALITDVPNLRDIVLFPLLRPVVAGAPAPDAPEAKA